MSYTDWNPTNIFYEQYNENIFYWWHEGVVPAGRLSSRFACCWRLLQWRLFFRSSVKLFSSVLFAAFFIYLCFPCRKRWPNVNIVADAGDLGHYWLLHCLWWCSLPLQINKIKPLSHKYDATQPGPYYWHVPLKLKGSTDLIVKYSTAFSSCFESKECASGFFAVWSTPPTQDRGQTELSLLNLQPLSDHELDRSKGKQAESRELMVKNA